MQKINDFLLEENTSNVGGAHSMIRPLNLENKEIYEQLIEKIGSMYFDSLKLIPSFLLPSLHYLF